MNDLITKSKNDILPFKKLGDLIYHEGPILSLFIDDDANMFLYRWVDCDEYTNKWMLSSISSNELSLFYHKKLSLRQYYEKCTQWVIIVIDNSLKIKELDTLVVLPEDYLPTKNSFYIDNLYTEFSNSLKAMYINRLAVISDKKIDIYDILALNIAGKENNEEYINDYIQAFTHKKIEDIASEEMVKELTQKFLSKSSNVTEIVQLFRALNHNVRKKILELISIYPGITITDICNKLKIEQSVISQHVAILKRSNLLVTQRKVNFVLYTINYKKLEEVQTAIDTLTEAKEVVYH
ncbi:MAG: metalloregulator ArsR/SmtB family transcription factor [Saprospiraceae bacterium]